MTAFDCLARSVRVAAKLVTKPLLVAGVPGAGGAMVPNNWALVLRKPSTGSAPGMKYGCAAETWIRYTFTDPRFPVGLLSFPVSPSNGCPSGDVLPGA